MAEQGLDLSEIRAARQQMCGKGMAELVWGCMSAERPQGGTIDHSSDGTGRETAVILTHEKSCSGRGRSQRPVGGERRDTSGRYGHIALLAAFALHSRNVAGKIEIDIQQRGYFADT